MSSGKNGFVEIVSGLSANERGVGSGLNRIQPNAPITVAGAGGARGAPAQAAAPQAAAR